MKNKTKALVALVALTMALLWNESIIERGWDWNFCPVSKLTTDPDHFTDMIDDGWEPVCKTQAFGREVILLKRRQPWFPGYR